MRWLAFAALLAALGASARAETTDCPNEAAKAVLSEPSDLDCAKGFEGLSASLAAQPGVTLQAMPTGPDLYQGKDVTYFASKPGMPGHPIIVEMSFKEGRGAVVAVTSHCAYGDKEGTESFLYRVNGMLKSMGATGSISGDGD